MKVTKQQYDKMAKRYSPGSPLLKNCLGAFFIGGAICTLGQFLLGLYGGLGLDKMQSATCVSITLVALSALLTGFGWYDDIAKIAGAGTLVPITGFANAVVSPALEFKSEGYILGVGAKLFVISGPVIVYGTAAGVLYGIIEYLLRQF